MAKWNIVLSTTDPFNYVGMIQVRQGNKNSEVMEATILQNGTPYDLTGCRVYFESIIGDQFPVQLAAKIINARKGKIEYTFDDYSMQDLHRQTADFIIYKNDELVATTQDFSYFVIKAVSKTEVNTGSYWQSIDDLIADMTDFINENKGDFIDWANEKKEELDAWQEQQEADFSQWFESIRGILLTIDPGGVMLAELMDARRDIQGVQHESISARLLADLDYLYQKLKEVLFTLDYGEIEVVDILQDNQFSDNHEVETVETVEYPIEEGALVIATVDDPEQNVFSLDRVGGI